MDETRQGRGGGGTVKNKPIELSPEKKFNQSTGAAEKKQQNQTEIRCEETIRQEREDAKEKTYQGSAQGTSSTREKAHSCLQRDGRYQGKTIVCCIDGSLLKEFVPTMPEIREAFVACDQGKPLSTRQSWLIGTFVDLPYMPMRYRRILRDDDFKNHNVSVRLRMLSKGRALTPNLTEYYDMIHDELEHVREGWEGRKRRRRRRKGVYPLKAGRADRIYNDQIDFDVSDEKEPERREIMMQGETDETMRVGVV
eukprot:753730-Hanusia_phi.AAC.1